MSSGLRSKASRLAAIASRPFAVKDILSALARGETGEARRVARAASGGPDLGAEKIVSRKLRCLWTCNPKVASRSIMSALLEADPDARVLRGRSISEVRAMHPEAAEYFSFAFVRHPFGRALSFHRELHFAHQLCRGEQRRAKRAKRQDLFARFPGLARTLSFDAFCRWLNTRYGSDDFADRHFLSQRLQIRSEDGRPPDFVGRLENIETDWQVVADKLGMPARPLPLFNTMAGWRAAPAALKEARTAAAGRLTPANRALLEARYDADCILFQAAGAA